MPPTEDARNGRKARLAPASNSGCFEAAQRFWQRSHAGDYLGLALLVVAFLLVKLFGEPFHTLFRLDDARLQHPHAEVQTVGILLLFISSAVIPILAILLWTLLFRPDTHKAHVTTLGLATSILLTLVLTDILKDTIGRPRPDLIARCKPLGSAPKTEFVGLEACAEFDHHKLHDGWRSFPSGHSSFAFSGLGFLAIFLAAQTHVLRPHASLITVLLCLAPLVGAALIAISRLEDYRHDVFDVVAGSLLGFVIAYGNWRRYYPSLLARDCDEPHSPPSSGRSSPGGAAFHRVRDEEEGFAGEVERFVVADEGSR